MIGRNSAASIKHKQVFSTTFWTAQSQNLQGVPIGRRRAILPTESSECLGNGIMPILMMQTSKLYYINTRHVKLSKHHQHYDARTWKTGLFSETPRIDTISLHHFT